MGFGQEAPSIFESREYINKITKRFDQIEPTDKAKQFVEISKEHIFTYYPVLTFFSEYKSFFLDILRFLELPPDDTIFKMANVFETVTKKANIEEIRANNISKLIKNIPADTSYSDFFNALLSSCTRHIKTVEAYIPVSIISAFLRIPKEQRDKLCDIIRSVENISHLEAQVRVCLVDPEGILRYLARICIRVTPECRASIETILHHPAIEKK